MLNVLSFWLLKSIVLCIISKNHKLHISLTYQIIVRQKFLLFFNFALKRISKGFPARKCIFTVTFLFPCQSTFWCSQNFHSYNQIVVGTSLFSLCLFYHFLRDRVYISHYYTRPIIMVKTKRDEISVETNNAFLVYHEL